jgi:hypothetical protein
VSNYIHYWIFEPVCYISFASYIFQAFTENLWIRQVREQLLFLLIQLPVTVCEIYLMILVELNTIILFDVFRCFTCEHH